MGGRRWLVAAEFLTEVKSAGDSLVLSPEGWASSRSADEHFAPVEASLAIGSFGDTFIPFCIVEEYDQKLR